MVLVPQVVSYTGGNRGQPAREVLENPCAENFILFQVGPMSTHVDAGRGRARLRGFVQTRSQ